jgi:hypothetical protein
MHQDDRHHRTRRWRQVHWRARRRLLVHALVGWLALVGVVGLGLLVTLGSVDAPRWVERGLVTSGALIAVVAAWRLLWPTWRRLRTRTRLARELDRAGRHHDTLAAVDEVLREPARWRAESAVRRVLVERLLARGDRLLADLDLGRLLPVWRPWPTFALLAAVVLVAFGLTTRMPEVLTRGWDEARAAWRPATAVTGGLRLAAGPADVIAGEDRTVAVYDLVATETEPPICEVRVGQGVWRALAARAVRAAAGDPVAAEPYEVWEADLREIRDDLQYRFRRGTRVSETRPLTVRRPPLLTELAATVVPPDYTGRPPREIPRLPAFLEVPAGSRLELTGLASSPLASARLVATEDSTALTVAGSRVAGSLSIETARRFEIELVDERGLIGRGELEHEVRVVPDRVPAVRLERPDDDGHVPLAAPLLLDIAAEDDYGLVSVALLIRRGDESGAWIADLPGRPTGRSDEDGWERLALMQDSGIPRAGEHEARLGLGELRFTVTPREVATDAAMAARLSLRAASLALVPGDVLELMIVARDNRQPPPAGEGRSSILRLQVPSSLDLLAEREDAQSEHQAGLEEMRRQSEALSAEIDRLRRELLKNPSLDWDRRQELQAALEQQQALRDEIDRLAGALGEDLEKLAENRLSSPELMEKMDRIEELLAEQQDRSLEALLEALRESLEEMSPRELTKAMEDLAREQNELQRRLDTAMDMLDDLAREQELEGLVDLAAEMIAEQQRLAEETRQMAESEADPADAEPGSEDDAEQSDGSDGESSEEESSENESAEGESSESESSESDESPTSENPNDDASAEDAQRPDAEELARQQDALAEQFESLQERLEETLAELQEQAESGEESAAEETLREAIEEALEQLEQQQTAQKMQQAGESMQQDQSDQASEQMEQALTDLAGLYHVLLKTQVAMQMATQQEQAGQMRDVAADLLALSERQEGVGAEVPVSLREVRADDLSRRQYEVVQGTVTVRDALGEVAEAAPQEILRMLNQLDELIATQGDVLEQLKEGRARAARNAADASLAEMNRVVINLLTQAQMTGQGGGSGQQQQTLSQQLRQMSEQQSGLNSLAEQLRQKQGRISQELRAGMQRLQQGQQGLAGQARELAEAEREREQRGESGRLLGDLSALADEMERVGDDAAGGLISEETLRRQERILSRLLDMHNASRERDWARRRESRSADELYADQEGAGAPELRDEERDGRRWRPVEEAPPAYRDLVRRYFHEIQRLHEQAGRLPGGGVADEKGDGI